MTLIRLVCLDRCTRGILGFDQEPMVCFLGRINQINCIGWRDALFDGFVREIHSTKKGFLVGAHMAPSWRRQPRCFLVFIQYKNMYRMKERMPWNGLIDLFRKSIRPRNLSWSKQYHEKCIGGGRAMEDDHDMIDLFREPFRPRNLSWSNQNTTLPIKCITRM